MLTRVFAAIAVASSLAAVKVASTSNASSAPPQNPYAGLYAKNVAGMGLPDQSLDRVLPPDADNAFSDFVEPMTQSKTCSQRCSRTCSTTCTTTRGCKRQTDGCGGAAVPATPRPSGSAAALPSQVRRSDDLTAHTFINAQRALALAGYEGICVDGVQSAAFTSALKDFQSRSDVGVTGVLSENTWQAIEPLLRRMSVR